MTPSDKAALYAFAVLVGLTALLMIAVGLDYI